MSVPVAAFHAYLPACWLRVSGPDAQAFLQGQFTNDVKQAREGQAVYGLWLDQKGHILADGFIIRIAEADYRVGSYFSAAATVRPRLEEYLVADEVEVADLSAEVAAVSILGAEAGAWLQAISPREGVVFQGRRTRGENWEWVFPAASAGRVHGLFAGCRAADAAEMERLRIESAIPAVPSEAGPGELPAEAGFGDEAISMTKGCYLGQEIVARLRSRGTARRGLFTLRGRGAAPALPAAIAAEGRAAGELRSAVPDRDGGGFTGRALLALRDSAGKPLVLAEDGRPVEIV
jgi:tRNA-modifying protein YgfZ